MWLYKIGEGLSSAFPGLLSVFRGKICKLGILSIFIRKISDINTYREEHTMANILVVEDEKNMQEIIAEYMHRSGHVCYTADDGVDALMVLKSHPMDLMI